MLRRAVGGRHEAGGREAASSIIGQPPHPLLSADLQQVSTVAGDGEEGHRDGAAVQAQFDSPDGLALLPDGRVLVADSWNHRIRVLSADLQQVSTVAGDGEEGHRDGAAAQAQFRNPDGRHTVPCHPPAVRRWRAHGARGDAGCGSRLLRVRAGVIRR